MRKMSGTSTKAARLPLDALRIAGSCALPLVMWFSLGRFVRWGLLYAAAHLSHGSWYQLRLVGVLFIFTLVVMVSLATVVGMLYTVREALAETRARREGEEAQETFFGALNRTALVFAGLYMTWGLVDQDMRDFENIDRTLNPDRQIVDQLQGVQSTIGDGLTGLDVRISVAAMLVAYGIKWFAGRRHENKPGKFTGILTTFGELAFVFYGLTATVAALKWREDWIEHRALIVGVSDATEDVRESPFFEWLGDVWPLFIEALVLPLAWLTVGILVYGAYAEDTQTTIRGTRLEAVGARVERSHNWTQVTLAKLTGGFTSRWIPLLNSLRLTVKGGPALFGLYALLYVGLHVGGGYLNRFLDYLTAGEPYLWLVTSVPTTFVADLLVTVLSMCLIAATYDLAATRKRLTEEPQDVEVGV